MLAEFYMGLAAMSAGVLAVYVAALLVLAQMGSASFSPSALYFLLRRPRVVAAAGLSFLATTCALAIAIRAAYPDFDAVPGDQGTQVLLDNAWFAVGLGGWILVAALGSGLVLVNFAATLRGPGLIRASIQEVAPQVWMDWLDYADPPARPTPDPIASILRNQDEEGSSKDLEDAAKEYDLRQVRLKQAYQQGELGDPFAPFFDGAIAALQERRYSVLDRVLADVTGKVMEWFNDESLDFSHRRMTKALVEHFDAVIEACASAGTESRIVTALQTLHDLATKTLGLDDFASAQVLIDAMGAWSKRLIQTHYDRAGSMAIELIGNIALADAEKNPPNLYREEDLFRHCSLTLGRVGEVVSEARAHVPSSSLIASWREDEVDAAQTLRQTMYWLTSEFIAAMKKAGGHTSNGHLFLDSLKVLAFAFAKAEADQDDSANIAPDFVGEIGRVGLEGARQLDGDTVLMVAYDLGEIADSLANDGPIADQVAHSAFEIGLMAESKQGSYKYEALSGSGDVADRLAKACAKAGFRAMSDAVSDLYKRGHTMHTPDADQELFLARVEARMGTTFEHR